MATSFFHKCRAGYVLLVKNGHANLGDWIRRALGGFDIDADEDGVFAVLATPRNLSLLQAQQCLGLVKHVLAVLTLHSGSLFPAMVLVLLRGDAEEPQLLQPVILQHLGGGQESISVTRYETRPPVNLELLRVLESLQVSWSWGTTLAESHEEPASVDTAGDGEGDAEVFVDKIQEVLELGRWNKQVRLLTGLRWVPEIETVTISKRD